MPSRRVSIRKILLTQPVIDKIKEHDPTFHDEMYWFDTKIPGFGLNESRLYSVQKCNRLPPIRVRECGKNIYSIVDGRHRITKYWLMKRRRVTIQIVSD